MSFINISTNQQTTAQRQMTERTPANLRNDFKVPIEIKKGDQMELVSLRLHLSSAIRIMEDENDTFVWTWGNAPNWTQHIVIVPDAPYYDGNEFANMVEACLNDSTTIPSFDRDVNEADHYNPTIPGGWSVTYTPVGGAVTSAKYEIDNQQCTYMADLTNGKIAEGHIGNLEKVLNSQLHSVSTLVSVNIEESFQNQSNGDFTMRQSWVSYTHDPTNDPHGGLSGLGIGDLEDEVFEDPAGNGLNGYLGRNFDYGQMSNVATFRGGRNGEQNPDRCISSIYDNGGKVFCTTSPLQGFSLADFIDDSDLVGPDVTLHIEMEMDTDDKLVVKEERIFTITKLDGATNNNWNLRLDLKAGEADFNPLMPGVTGPTFKQLYMHYIPEEGNYDPALESPFKNGLWAIGGYVDDTDPTGGDGTGQVPDNALSEGNWNFCVEAGNDAGINIYGPRNVWYYDEVSGSFSPGISSFTSSDASDVIRLNYSISGFRHDINRPTLTADQTPTLEPTAPAANGSFQLAPTRILGYNNVRVGLNSFNSYVNPDYTHKKNNLGGGEPIGAQTNLENCRWQIQLFNDPANVNLDGNGVNCPRCQIIGTENPEDTFPVDGKPFKSKIVEEIDLLTHSSNIVAASVPAGPSTVIISELNRNSRTGALNVSQKIDVPVQYQGHDVTQIQLHLNNSSGSVMDVVLDLYDSITDPTSTNVATRFAGLTPFSTTATHAVPANNTTGPVDFTIDADTSVHNVFYVVLREPTGTMNGLSIQGSFGVDLGGSNGNMLAGLKHEVVGNTVGSIGGFTPLTHDLCICVEITEVSTLKFYALQTPKYRLENPAGGAPVNPHITPEDAYQTDSAKTPTDAELQANLLFTLDNSGSTYGAKDTSYIKESHYPLVPVIACGAGGYYAAQTLAAEQTTWGDEIASYNCWDMQLAYRDIPTSKANRQIYESFPYRWIAEQPNNVPSPGDPPTAIKGTGYCFKFGKLLDTQIGAPQDPDPTVQNHYVTYQSTTAEPYVNTVIAELFPLNISSLQRILGFENLVQSTRNSTHFDPAIASTRRINEMPIGDTFTVELTSTPIKGFNGGTGDVNKALAVINVEELEVDTQSDGGVIYSTSTRRPVDLNIAQDTSFHSLNIQLRDANGKILRAVEAPLDVVLYKSQPESAKMEQAIRELKDVIQGKKQDARDVQLANIGVNNPLLGVIPS